MTDREQLTPTSAARVMLPGPIGPLAALDADPARLEAPALGTVVLLPGYTGSKEDFLTVLAPLAAEGYTAVAVDQRGQHESPWGDDEAYAFDRLAADLLAVTAQLPAFARQGQTIDVVVSSLGNAKSLRGGTLVMTPMKGVDNQVYALVQGNILVGGAGASAGTRTARWITAMPS